MGRLDGKIALVTGGNGGIGLATAKRFAAEGATVVVTGRRQAELDAAVVEIGHGATGVRGDVSDLGDLDRLFAEIQSRHGRLDVLFANAGAAITAPLGEVTEEDYDSQFDVNTKGLFFTVQKALPLMAGGGSIVLNASIVATKGFGGMSVYSATKAAVRSFARTWTSDLRGMGIRVNVVSPGPVSTPGASALAGGEEAFASSMGPMVPLGRVGRPEEIADAVLYLASDESRFVAGIDLVVDGGVAQV